MKKSIILSAALVLGVACSEKISESGAEEQTAKGFPYSFTAVIDSNTEAESRVNFSDPTPADPANADWSVVWKVGDQIRVQNQPGKDKTVIYVVKSVSGGVATFEPKEGEDLGKFGESTTYFASIGGIAEGTNYSYLFEFNSANRGGVHMGLSTYKSILPGTIDNSFFTAVAKATLADGKISFRFIPVISYLRFEIPEGMTYDVGQLYFSSSGKKVSGLFNARMDADSDTIFELGSAYSGGSTNLPLWYGDGGTQKVATPYPKFATGIYYVPVLPTAIMSKVVIYDTAGAVKHTTDFTDFTMERGKIYNLGTIPVD